MFDALGFCALFALSLVALELVARKLKLSPEYSRRLAHLGSGFFAIFMWQRSSLSIFVVCLLLLLTLISLSYFLRLFRSVHSVSRKTYGEILLPIGILAAALISSATDRPQDFIVAILITSVSDVVAGLISNLRKLERPSKLGSIGFFVVTVGILSLNGYDMTQTIIIAYILTITEMVSPLGSDNLTVPIVATLLLF